MVDGPEPDATYTFPLTRRTLTLGRDPSCDVRLKGVGVSRLHARLYIDEKESVIEDLEDTSGIRIDGRPVRKAAIGSGAILTIGVHKLSVQRTAKAFILQKIDDPEQASAISKAAPSGDMTIGRDSSNSLHLAHPMVSRFHATAHKTADGGCAIEDHGSTNGTFINGKPVRHARVADGDVVHVGPYRFYCDQGRLHLAQDFNRIKLEAFNVTVVKSDRKLLDTITISILPGEFVAVLGPSGSGKTSLARTLIGRLQPREGAIFYNGLPIKTFFSAFNSAIGFVSQENLLRPELTVEETFFEQSRLRLPKDSLIAEHRERIREVTELLGLSPIACRRIADISGGEAKRVHFGIELLSSPTIIFLDEPFAGLDPGLISKFMTLFRTICDRGHTLLLTTHTLTQINSCNRILFMNGGKLMFSGTPAEILKQYGIASLADAYDKGKPVFAQGSVPRGAATGKEQARPKQGKSTALTGRLYKPKRISMARQFSLLVVRYTKIALRDRKSMVLMLLQAPLIALVCMCTYKPTIDYFPVSFYFCLSISAVWMGGMNSIREIAREWPVIDRELRIGLSPVVYCLSKTFVFGLAGLVQAIVFGFCIHSLFTEFVFNLQAAMLLSAACVSGAVMGLCISAFSKNVNMAIGWLPIIFIPQIFFSGVLVPFDEMAPVGRFLSYLTIARYIFSMFKKTIFLEQPMRQMSEWNALLFLCFGLIILMIAGIKYRRFITT